MYPGRHIRTANDTETRSWPFTYADCYLCPDCDALVRAGKPLPEGVAAFSVVVREDG
jgi:hypothetical protein